MSQVYLFSVARGPFREEFYQCVTHGKYTSIWQERLYSTLSVMLMYILPLVVMVTAYCLILYSVTQKSRLFGEWSRNLYILNAVRCPYVRNVTLGVARSVANDVIMRMTS